VAVEAAVVVGIVVVVAEAIEVVLNKATKCTKKPRRKTFST
jgi:hypothetical protein